MSEMNPIVATLLQILESRKKDLALAQRREEAKAENSFRMEQVKHAQDVLKHQATRDLADIKFREATARQAVAEQFRREAASGTQEVDTIQGLPQQTGFQSKMIPGEKVPYDFSQQTFGQPSEVPLNPQIADSEFGPVSVKGVVPYEKMLSRKMDADTLEAQLKAITARLEAQAKLPSQLALESAKGANAKSVAQLNQEAATGRTDAQIAAQKLIANNRDATAKEVARIRAQGGASQDAEMLAPMVESVILGEVPLAQIPIAKNTRGAVINSAKSQGFVIPDAAITKKVPFTHAMFAITDRIENDIIPKLAKNPAEAKGKGILAKLWPTELANEFAKIELDATTQAREAGEKGNFSNSDIGRALHSLGDPGFTQDQIRDRLRTLKNKIYNKLDNEYLGGLPDKQKILILQKYNYNPSDLLATDKNGKIISSKEYPTGIPKYIFQDGMWGVYNPSTGKIRRVD